ncbi:hypothetical protein ACFL35_18970 [Candidatus Riflebacteria bacterium]
MKKSILIFVLLFATSSLPAREIIYMDDMHYKFLQGNAPMLYKMFFDENDKRERLAHYPSGQMIESKKKPVNISPEEKRRRATRRRKKRNRGKRRWLYALGFGSLYYHVMADQASRDYKNARSSSDSQQEFDRLQKNENMRNVFLGAVLISSQIRF